MYDILIVGLIRDQHRVLQINLEKLAFGEVRRFYGIYSSETLDKETLELFRRFNVIVMDLGESPTYSIPEALKILEPKNSRNSYILFDRMNKLWNEYSRKFHSPESTIIRLRPDMLLTILGKLPVNERMLYVGHDYCIASDNFAFGNQTVMSIYMNAINTLRMEWTRPIEVNDYFDIPVGERLMRTHLIRNNVPFRRPCNITIRIIRKYRPIHKLIGYWRLFVYSMKDASSVLNGAYARKNV